MFILSDGFSPRLFNELADERDEAWRSGDISQAILMHIMLYDAADDNEKTELFADLSRVIQEWLSLSNGDDHSRFLISIFSTTKPPFMFSKGLARIGNICALIITMFVELLQLDDNEEVYSRLYQLLVAIEKENGKRSHEYSSMLIYSITDIYQHTDSALAIELYEDAPYVVDYFSDEGTLSDLYFIIGSRYNNDAEKRIEGLRLLERGYEIRVRYSGDKSVYSLMMRLIILENHYLSGEYERAIEIASQLSTVESDKTANDECFAIIRCYSNLILAGIKESSLIKQNIDIEPYLQKAQDDLNKINIRDMMYTQLFFLNHTLWSMLNNKKRDFQREEYHLLLVYNYVKEHAGKSLNSIFAYNNLAKCWLNNGRMHEAKTLLKEVLELISELEAENTEAAAYVYNLVSLIYDPDYFGENQQYYFDNAVLNINMQKSDALIIRLNAIIAKLNRPTKQYLLEAENALNEITAIINNHIAGHNNITLLHQKAITLLMIKQKRRNEARKSLNDYLKKLKESQDETTYCDALRELYEVIIDLASKDMLESITIDLAHSLNAKIKSILTIYDEYHMLKATSQVSSVLNMVLSLTYSGKIDLPIETLYEIIANYKYIYSYVIKLKKDMQILNPTKREYYDKVDQLNKELMDIELNELYRNVSDDYSELAYKKSLLELESFIDAVLPDVEWKSYEDLLSGIPDNTLFVDYYCFPGRIDLDHTLGESIYACFVVYKNADGNLIVKNVGYSSAYGIRISIFGLWHSILAKKNTHIMPPLITLTRKSLYNMLIKPLRQYINEDIKYIYISPDFDLTVLPFQVICNKVDNYDWLKHSFVYVESIRDIKSPQFVSTEGVKALVIGNAKFSTRDYDSDDIPEPLKELEAVPLPLSKVEAAAVADRIGAVPILRENANKNVLRNSDADIIHIATHGYYKTLPDDDEFTVNPLKRSCLFFSGVNDWLQTGIISDKLGTGILTAEELCNTVMKPPSLVVLSACNSAYGETDCGNSIIGLRTALKACGAKTILVSVWEVDDFASAVIMTRFYDNLKTMPAADALKQSQLYLKEVTIKDLRDDMWFDESRLRRVGLAVDDLVRFSKQDENMRPFESDRYWGGYLIIE